MNFSHIVMGLALLFMIQLQSLFSNRIFPIKPYSSYRISEILSFITSLFYCLTISILTNSDTIRTYLPLCSLLMCIVPCLINYHFKRQYLPLSNLDLPNQDLQTKPGLLHNLKKPKLLVRQRVIDDEESALYNKKQFDDNTQNPIQRSLADQRLLVNESVLNEPIRQAFIRNENERPNNQSFNKELELQSPVHLLNRDVDAGKHSELSTIRQSSEEFVKLIRPVIVHNTLQQGSFNSQKADLENVKLIKPTILRNTTHQSSFTCENFQNPIQRADEEIVKLIIPAIIRNTTHQGSFKRRSEADNLQNPIQKIISLI